MPGLRGSSRGDQYFLLEVETPVGISKKQETMLREISDLGLDKCTPKSTRFKKLIS